ncbi:ExeA family protein [Geobacter sp. DSM 9736]|uniref:ExeA family protein n=1 Tax=Geobacter sp. DSM 9736 TaxID=1277350 RepID=UPI000B500EC9|nr:AAA family ATPase [Geobacter sp. DSM 9736]SNB46145.1 Type II secretory pathway, component ExeA (predicted ATPase) [Geobacter sp. DSM 9736]
MVGTGLQTLEKEDMYTNFYNLVKEPFHITPDPEFLFLSNAHKEALASIIYGVEQRKGFVAVIGEVGLGKTTILRSFLDQVDNDQTKIIYLFNSNISFKGLLQTIYQNLGHPPESDDVVEMVNRLHQILIDYYKSGRNVVLVIDEAQNMPLRTLENLRMLSNLETSTDKLIQIVFSGQPEFEQKLKSYELRQLKQRIAIKAVIKPFNENESMDYINHRLTKAAGGEVEVFTRGALKLIVRHAEGIPRLINVLCDNCMISGFGYQQKRIEAKTVKEIVADLEQKEEAGFPRWMTILIVSSVVAVGALGIWKAAVEGLLP